jgi:hypothetical protein
VFFGRMVPLVRSMISVPAGVERMSIPLFLALTAAGSLIWNSIFVVAGYLLGENWHVVESYAGILSKVVLVAIAIAVVVFVILRIRRRGADVPADRADDPTEQIPVIRARPPEPMRHWSAQPASTEWSVQPTQRLPAIHPDAQPAQRPRR